MVRKRANEATAGPSKKVLTKPSASQIDAGKRVLQANQFAVLPEDNGGGDSVPIVKKERIPPLFTPVKDIAKLSAELTKQKLLPRFKLCSIGTKILCSNLEEYKKIGCLLKENNVDFFTHDLPSSKPLKVVLRGLPSFEASAVKSELERLGLKAEAVYPMNRRTNPTTSYRDQLFLVHLTKGSTNLAALKTQIRDLFQIIIGWEHYKPQHRDVTQCMNCLSYGHGTKNCHMKANCGKCAGAHSTASCEQNDDIEPTCVNCGGNHQASNRGCPKRAEFVNIRRKAAINNQPGRLRNHRLPPALTEAQYPALQHRRHVPNLAPLPLNNRQANPVSIQTVPNSRTAQHRLAAAAAQPNPGSPTAPGFSYASLVSSESVDESPFTSEELVTLVAEVIIILRSCKTRSEQLHAALSLVTKYGP